MKDGVSSETPFHDVGSVFPDDIDLVWFEPSTTVAEALRTMSTNRYSQAPVVENGRVLGVFSLWSLAVHLMDGPNLSPNDLVVEDVMEQIPNVTVDDPLDRVLDHLNLHDAVLVESPHGVQAIATGTDVLKYFYRVASPYLLLKEIELSLRNLIQACVTPTKLQALAEKALGWKYDGKKEKIPNTLDEMSFEDYRAIVTAKGNWDSFRGILGANKELVGIKLEQIRKIRNSIFHFRDSVSARDHRTLVNHRNWLFEKTTTFHDRKTRESAK